QLLTAHDALATRGFETPSLATLLSNASEVVQPFQFSSSRDADSGLSVLELTEVDPATLAAVTPAAPLKLNVTTTLKENEHVLPVAFDGEFFVPLGKARKAGGQVEIEIDRLTPPVNTRSLFGAIRIHFQKVISQALGLEFEYPIIAVAQSDGTGSYRYIKDQDEVSAQVKKASRILLYIHGIIGDTRGMAASAFATGLEVNP